MKDIKTKRFGDVWVAKRGDDVVGIGTTEQDAIDNVKPFEEAMEQAERTAWGARDPDNETPSPDGDGKE